MCLKSDWFILRALIGLTREALKEKAGLEEEPCMAAWRGERMEGNGLSS